jgi:hypothetical protein
LELSGIFGFLVSGRFGPGQKIAQPPRRLAGPLDAIQLRRSPLDGVAENTGLAHAIAQAHKTLDQRTGNRIGRALVERLLHVVGVGA